MMAGDWDVVSTAPAQQQQAAPTSSPDTSAAAPPAAQGDGWNVVSTAPAPPSMQAPQQPAPMSRGNQILSNFVPGVSLGRDVANIFSGKRGTMADRAIASPEAQFAQHLLVSPLIGTGQIAQSKLGHAVMPMLDPLGAASDFAGALNPNNPFTAQVQQQRAQPWGSFSAMGDALSKRVSDARAAVGDTGTNWPAVLGDIGAFFLPLPGGKARAAEEAAPAVANAAEDAIREAESAHAASSFRVAQAERDLAAAQTRATSTEGKYAGLPTRTIPNFDAEVQQAQNALDAARDAHAQSYEALRRMRNPEPVQEAAAAPEKAGNDLSPFWKTIHGGKALLALKAGHVPSFLYHFGAAGGPALLGALAPHAVLPTAAISSGQSALLPIFPPAQ